MHNKITEEILKQFNVTLQNIKYTGRLFMAEVKFRKKMGASYTTFDLLLDKVVNIILLENNYWGITIPIKIKELSDVTGRRETATKEDLKKLEKLKYIMPMRLPYGKKFFVRVFPEYANIICQELPEFNKLIKKFEYYVKAGFVKESQEIWNEMKEHIRKIGSEKKAQKEKQRIEPKPETESKQLTQAEVDERMAELRKTLGLNKKEREHNKSDRWK